jgi:HupE / UreJ protein
MVATLFLLTLLGGSAAVEAHMLAPSLLEVREIGDGRFEVEWRTPLVGVPGAELRPVLPPGCRPTGEPTLGVLDAASVTRWPAECTPPTLVGRRFTATGIVENRADVLLRVELADGRRFRTVLGAERPDFVVPERQTWRDVFSSYLVLGIEHILTGFDHLLFVLGLVLLIRGRLLLWTLTAFTLGHSLTLGLAVLGVVHVPQMTAEAAIAATIFVLALELTRSPLAPPSLFRRRPSLLAACFGLLHGLGFAGALAEVGLPQGEIPMALFSFNVGIEVGQIAFVAAVLAVAAIAGRRVGRELVARARLAPAYAIGSLAAFWMLERIRAVLSS